MWTTAKLYKHRNNTDVAFQPLSWTQLEDGSWRLGVMWYNIVPSHKPYCMRLNDTIRIQNDRLTEWEIFNA